ncbi:hypothetical protein DB346_16165 [Verrucomicrobia bacterium LW23]|nr:hypothetical protein DB346_16165 [Verrucomicrobia bacterium LW23]
MIFSTTEYLQLVETDDQPSRHRLRWEAAPLDVWLDVLSQHPEFKRAVASNKLLEIPVMRVLARDNDPLVRCDIAEKPNLPDDLFYLLANDADEAVRARVAYNKNVPLDILHYLKNDSSDVVVQAVKNRLRPAGKVGKNVVPFPVQAKLRASQGAALTLAPITGI